MADERGHRALVAGFTQGVHGARHARQGRQQRVGGGGIAQLAERGRRFLANHEALVAEQRGGRLAAPYPGDNRGRGDADIG